VFSLSRSILWGIFKTVGALLLGGAVLWEVTLHSGPPNGKVYVHVPQGNGDLMIDDEMYHVRTLWETPVVCVLQPGHHALRLSRDGQPVFEQQFSIDSGEELVLTASEDRDHDDHVNHEELP
jgi:hypothetical protein